MGLALGTNDGEDMEPSDGEVLGDEDNDDDDDIDDDCEIDDEDNEDCYDNINYEDDDKGGFVYIWIIMRYFEFLYV